MRHLLTPRRLWPVVGVFGVLALGALVVGLLGGWSEATDATGPKAERVAPGEPVAAGPVDIEVHGWGIVEMEDYLADDTPIVANLAVHLTMTTTANDTLSLPTHIVRPTTIEEEGWLTAVRAGDLTRLSSLTPGVTEEVIVTTPVVDPAELEGLGEQELELAVLGYEWREHGLSRELNWWEEDPVAVVTVPRDQAYFATYQDSLVEDDA